MARRDALHIFGLLLLANNYVRYSSCTYHGRHYDKYAMDTEKICYGRSKSSIEINTQAAIVWPNHMFDRWIVHPNVHCKFVFKAAKGDGLFGVIQKMSFRKNGSQCIDYVQFKRKDTYQTEKFCGLLDRSRTKYSDPESENSGSSSVSLPTETYAEYDPSGYKSGGELETEIFISHETLLDDEFLALNIVYTPYKNCSNVDLTKYTSIGLNTCLQNEFFCDGVYNHVLPNVRSDEDNCPNNANEYISTGTGTKVTVGAVTTMILCFIIFVMCLWICKRSQKLCWSINFADANVCSSRPGQLSHETEGSANPPVPTAPMLEVAVPSSVADKDLPPSYDSLFPEQSNPVRS
ncbi:PREDICTED: uncharacterized protein LOC107193978 [Dufourea novaeangliae]|uniref:CUB domain-containing protein n=1 Tax=Dufourea novaeangliae TaxID=178035 RepID=A0A154P1D8_DUFNO|nr:PREDICTED: uncharacterized protein LOC107193978 [Dufourea novaeangliae]KZC05653.1 hypothetical protein WN55_04593 [Dufourea novaeangliae]